MAARSNRRVPTGAVVALLCLALFAWMADSGTREKSVTFDELAHLSSGTSYWRAADTRLHPMNGLLPQAWAALPAHLSDAVYPAFQGPDWEHARIWDIAYTFFFRLGNDVDGMLRWGRRMVLMLAVALGIGIYAWSQRLFGPTGAVISIVLYAFCPNFLAHGSLATSDVALSAFLLAAVAASWAALRVCGPLTLVAASLTVGLLFLCKTSALLFVPMWLLMAAVRIVDGAPLELRWGRPRRFVRAPEKGLAIAASSAAIGSLSLLAIWAAHGFRYVSGREPSMQFPWERVADLPGWAASGIEAARSLHALPESYLYGIAYVMSRAQSRLAFLNGEIGVEGWWSFFPYAFAVKTPLATLAMLVLAAAAAVAPDGEGRRSPRARGLHRVAPLLILLVVYWTAALQSHLNIGFRHLLPTLPALFILAGGAGSWFVRPGWIGKAGVGLLLMTLAIESWSVRPHYLAFFNQSVGGPAHGYRHLVDSSLDWGQDLPGLERWIDRERASGFDGNVYLSYFGTASPEYYGVSALPLPGFMAARFRPAWRRVPLTGGIYAISATMLQNLYVSSFSRGPWTPEKQRLFDEVRERIAAGEATNTLFSQYEWLRFARLTSYLREREPDDHVGYSILIYRLSDEEARAALDGPLVELNAGSP